MDLSPSQWNLILKIVIAFLILDFIGLTIHGIFQMIKSRKWQKRLSRMAPSQYKASVSRTPERLRVSKESTTSPLVINSKPVRLSRLVIPVKKKPKPFLEPKLTKAIERIVTNSH